MWRKIYFDLGVINTFSYYRKNKLEAYVDGRTLLSKANQEAIANKVYWDGNRSTGYQLGNRYKDDGFKYIGRGAIQLTGFSNYLRFSKWLKDTMILLKPELVATKYYWESALFFFEENKIWSLCNGISTTQINKVTAKINKSTDSYQNRVELVRKYYELTK